MDMDGGVRVEEAVRTDVSLVVLVSFIAQMAMIFGGVFPYIPQYNEIYKSGNAEGFSLYVCLALLAANILRILFWFGKPFETPLLLQSILMNIAMLMMIHLCVKIKARSDIIKKKDRLFSDLDPKYFWEWTDFQSYVQCILAFTFMGTVMMWMFCDWTLFVESVGFLAVFVEACLGVPQFLRNYRNGSTRGMNKTMVFMWTCGDVFKTTYFVMRQAPVQFTICGCLQIGVDLAILTQIWVYSSKPIS
jgi:uncharacterized protein with PQ loop repeat